MRKKCTRCETNNSYSHTVEGFRYIEIHNDKEVDAWEKGTNTPNGPARRLIGMIKDDPRLMERFQIITR